MLLLPNGCAIRRVSARSDILDLDRDDVTAAQLAVDREVEQRSIAQSSMLIKEEADCPDLARLERPLSANLTPRIPGTAFSRRGSEL